MEAPLFRYSADTAADSRGCFLKDRAAEVISRFNAGRIRNGEYAAESNGIPFQIEGTVTRDRTDGMRGGNFLTVITKVRTNRGEVYVYREETEEWWTNSHDESDSFTETVPVDLSTWDCEGWFSDPEWTGRLHAPRTKGPVPGPPSGVIPYDALYYEGYDRRGIMTVFLRRCAEGYRLLRFCRRNAEEPADIGFSEQEVQEFYRQVSGSGETVLFEDFLLTEAECGKIAAYAECDRNPDALPALESYVYANPMKFAAFARKTGAAETEEYGISALMVQGLLVLRCMDLYGDYLSIF